MKWALLPVIPGLLALGCADAALHAANGTPERFEPLSVAMAQRAWRMPDGSLGICVDMNLTPGAWRIREIDGTGAFSALIPNPPDPGTASVPYDAWQSQMTTGESGAGPGNCDYQVPQGACLLDLELVPRKDIIAAAVTLDDQTLRVSDSRRQIATLQLHSEGASGNPIFYPLVPLGYVADVSGVLVLIPIATAIAFTTAAVVLVVVPFSTLVDDEPAPAPPPLVRNEPAPCGLAQ